MTALARLLRSSPALLVLIVIAAIATSSVRADDTATIRKESGGAKEIFDDGAELEVRDGATVDIQDGAVIDIQDGALVTNNSTETDAGPMAITGPKATGTVTLPAGDVSRTVTGNFGDANYNVLLEATANVSPMGYANKTATSFDVLYQTATGSPSVRWWLFHNQ